MNRVKDTGKNDVERNRKTTKGRKRNAEKGWKIERKGKTEKQRNKA
jgi:hypothetical protein